MRYKDKNILVVGGTSGIGLAVSKQIANEGGRLIVLGRNKAKLSDAKNIIPENDHYFHNLDCSNESEFGNYIKEINIKINSAIVCAGAHLVRPLAVSTSTHYLDMFNSNFIVSTNTAKILLKNSSKDDG